MKSILLLFTFFCLDIASGQTDRFVTLTAKAPPSVYATNSITISANETAHVETFSHEFQPSAYNWGAIILLKDSIEFTYCPTCGASGAGWNGTVKGPATISVRAYNSMGVLLTLKITPESSDPNKTLILPPSTNQVSVTLETSTNLVNWATATNGIYGSPDVARFFRIHMQTQ